jgi:hypothetical protein
MAGAGGAGTGTGGQSINKTMSSLALVSTSVPQSQRTIINALVNRLQVKVRFVGFGVAGVGRLWAL